MGEAIFDIYQIHYDLGDKINRVALVSASSGVEAKTIAIVEAGLGGTRTGKPHTTGFKSDVKGVVGYYLPNA
ncbi:MAG TPA: hypothetical protein VMC80_02750 [Patescibacteria group bacterium]|nr:hypothetical protein [Patescibacteria group bacterium]